MFEKFISRGFRGRATGADRAHKERIPPGHCVTKWSTLDTVWTGVSVDTLLEGINLDSQPAVRYVIAFSDGGYTTNLPLADVRGGRAWMVDEYDGRPLAPEHGGPAGSASNSSEKTARDSGSRWAITTAIPGKNSDTQVIKESGPAA